jgi:alkylated DNA nucleotide flippase Atl1
MSRHVFLVDGPSASSATPVSLADAGLRERRDLQEWVIAHPEVLGDDLLVVTSEFGRWEGSDGLTASERLDVLALSSSGRLVVVELKRGEDRSIHIQAITYAALVSNFTPESLAEVHADFLSRRTGTRVSSSDALVALRAHVDGDFDPDLLDVPRIVLLAAHPPAQVITSTVWLTNLGLDIELHEVRAWRLGGQVAVTFDQVYPVEGVDDLLLGPARRRTDEVVRVAEERQRAVSAVKKIIDADLLSDGAVLTLRPTVEVTAQVRAEVDAWVARHPARGEATWVNDLRAPLLWAADGQKYKPTTLVKQILQSASAVDRSCRGPSWWVTEDGLDLTEVAGQPKGSAARDWSDLHEVLSVLAPAEWTSYGDVGDVIGLPARPGGTHVGRCGQCPNAWRVLTADGTPAVSFHWSDPSETRTCRQVLEAEGLMFDESGRVNQDSRVGLDVLRDRLAGSQPGTDRVVM